MKIFRYKSPRFYKILINTGALISAVKSDLIIPCETICLMIFQSPIKKSFNDIPKSDQEEYGLCS